MCRHVKAMMRGGAATRVLSRGHTTSIRGRLVGGRHSRPPGEVEALVSNALHDVRRASCEAWPAPRSQLAVLYDLDLICDPPLPASASSTEAAPIDFASQSQGHVSKSYTRPNAPYTFLSHAAGGGRRS